MLYRASFVEGELEIAEPEKNLGYERFRIGEVDENELSNGARELYHIVKEKEKKRMNIRLEVPALKHEEQVMEMKRIFLENNEDFDGCAGLENCNTYEEWLDFDRRLSVIYGESYVPSTVYLAIRNSDDKLVGIIDFRHDLSEFLLNFGGNIGYSVVPQERRKGYATEMLRLTLEECRKFGKDKVLITCDPENIASSKTIIHNGGILENEIVDNAGLSKSGKIQRYWIYL